jgi:protein-disulfide isomerase
MFFGLNAKSINLTHVFMKETAAKKSKRTYKEEKVATPEVRESEKVVTENKKDNDYITVDLRGFSKIPLPVSILLSAIILSVGLGSGLYFGLKEAGKTFTGTTTNTGTQTGNAADPYAVENFPEGVISMDDDPVKGNKGSAKVAIVEFSDYGCVWCRYFATGVNPRTGQKEPNSAYQQIINEYVNTGKAVLVYRDYPSPGHDPFATKAAIAGSCIQKLSGNEAYFKFHDAIFGNFDTVISTTTGRFEAVESKFAEVVKSTGVDYGRFEDCYKNEQTKAEVNADLASLKKLETDSSGKSHGGQIIGRDVGFGTPTFIIGKIQSDGTVKGRIVIGAYPIYAFRNVIEEQLR